MNDDLVSESVPQDSFRFGQNIRQAMLDIRALFSTKEKKMWLLKTASCNFKADPNWEHQFKDNNLNKRHK